MSKKVIFLTILIFLQFLFVPIVHAEGKEACEDNSPNGKPVLVSAEAVGKDSVTLTWTKAQDPVTHYLLAFSRNETSIEFGNTNIGGKDTTTYTVTNLQPGQKYYFKVRPVNGCRPGDFSNKLSATPGEAPKLPKTVKKTNISIYKPVLGVTTSPEPATISAETPSPVPEESNTKALQCSKCVSWPFLVGQIIILFVYFTFANNAGFAKPILSVFIPFVAYFVFAYVNRGCVSNDFMCKYFIPLQAIIFMTTLLMFKNKFLKKI